MRRCTTHTGFPGYRQDPSVILGTAQYKRRRIQRKQIITISFLEMTIPTTIRKPMKNILRKWNSMASNTNKIQTVNYLWRFFQR